MEVSSTQSNPIDNVTLDIPLFIRLMEYAKEDAQSDMDLHKVAENIIEMSQGGTTLTMEDYDAIISIQKGSEDKEMSQDELNEIYKRIIQQRAGIK
jgi:ribonuclease PH